MSGKLAQRRDLLNTNSPSSSSKDKAEAILVECLSNVFNHFTTISSHRRGDKKLIHELRVAVRNTLSTIDLLEDYLPIRKTKWLRKKLRKSLDLSSEIRDIDVLKAHRSHKASTSSLFIKEFKKRRKVALKILAKYASKVCEKSELDKRLRKIVSKSQLFKLQNKPFKEWSRSVTIHELKLMQECLPRDAHNQKQLHRFRVQVKSVRYAVALLCHKQHDEGLEKIRNFLETIQKKLGRIHDLGKSASQLSKWIESQKDISNHAVIETLRAEGAQLRSLIDSFSKWWQPSQIETFQESLRNDSQ